jgi:putative ABC transport system substrate-binding protein
MKRREFITLLAGAAVTASPFVARAQQIRRVAVISTSAETNPDMQVNKAAFEQRLSTLGWRQGQNLHIEYRWAGGDAQRARAHVTEVVDLAPDVIIAGSTAVLALLQKATRTIPTIFAGVSDPVAQGFVPNLSRPGGNITGFTAYEFSIGGKWLDLLKQISPSIKRVALLGNPTTSPQFKFNLASIESAGSSLGVDVVAAPVRDKPQLEAAIADIARAPAGGLIVANDQFLLSRHLSDVVGLTARHRVPAIYAQRPFVVAGGLMRYGLLSIDQYRGAAIYVDRILKGANPGDLPTQLPTRYELVINVKAAAALELELPMALMLRADEVIE